MNEIFAPLRGKKSYIFGVLLILNALYSMATGEKAPTFDDPSAVGGEVSTTLMASLGMAIRAGVAKLEALLKRLVADDDN